MLNVLDYEVCVEEYYYGKLSCLKFNFGRLRHIKLDKMVFLALTCI